MHTLEFWNVFKEDLKYIKIFLHLYSSFVWPHTCNSIQPRDDSMSNKTYIHETYRNLCKLKCTRSLGSNKNQIVTMDTVGIVFLTLQWRHNDHDGVASQITSLTIAYPTVYSGADQRKHQSSASLAFVRGIQRGPVNSPHKLPVTRKMFPLMTSSWKNRGCFFWHRLYKPASGFWAAKNIST